MYLIEGGWSKLLAGGLGGIIVFLLNYFQNKYREFKRVNYINKSLIDFLNVSDQYIEGHIKPVNDLLDNSNLRKGIYIDTLESFTSTYFKAQIVEKFDSIDLIKLLQGTSYNFPRILNQFIILEQLEKTNIIVEYKTYYNDIKQFYEIAIQLDDKELKPLLRMSKKKSQIEKINKKTDVFIENLELHLKSLEDIQCTLKTLKTELEKKIITFAGI